MKIKPTLARILVIALCILFATASIMFLLFSIADGFSQLRYSYPVILIISVAVSSAFIIAYIPYVLFESVEIKHGCLIYTPVVCSSREEIEIKSITSIREVTKRSHQGKQMLLQISTAHTSVHIAYRRYKRADIDALLAVLLKENPVIENNFAHAYNLASFK